MGVQILGICCEEYLELLALCAPDPFPSLDRLRTRCQVFFPSGSSGLTRGAAQRMQYSFTDSFILPMSESLL